MFGTIEAFLYHDLDHDLVIHSSNTISRSLHTRTVVRSHDHKPTLLFEDNAVAQTGDQPRRRAGRGRPRIAPATMLHRRGTAIACANPGARAAMTQ